MKTGKNGVASVSVNAKQAGIVTDHGRGQEVLLVDEARRRRNVRAARSPARPGRQAYERRGRGRSAPPSRSRSFVGRRDLVRGHGDTAARMLLEPGYAEGTRVVHLTHTTLVVEALCGEQAELHGEPDLAVLCDECLEQPALGVESRSGSPRCTRRAASLAARITRRAPDPETSHGRSRSSQPRASLAGPRASGTRMPPSAEQFRELFMLDPEVTYLNHGSFGAVPRPVFERRTSCGSSSSASRCCSSPAGFPLGWRESGRASPGTSERRRGTTSGSFRT